MTDDVQVVVVHVDDNELQRRNMVKILGNSCTLVQFDHISSARAYGGSVSVYLLDGNVDAKHDGLYWAADLLKANKTVVVLSADDIPEHFKERLKGATYLKKGSYTKNELFNALGIKP